MWFERFKQSINVEFTEEDFNSYKEMIEKDLPVYERFVKKGSKLLDCGCGLGVTAIPLSHYYDVTGVDIEDEVIKYAKKNAEKFGKNTKVMKGDLYELDKIFKKDSFDACIHGGVMEHFPKEDIIPLLKKQLIVAPLIIASVPVNRDDVKGKSGLGPDGIFRQNWTPEEWLDFLKDFNVIFHRHQKMPKRIGGFKELVFVIKRG